MSRIIQVWNKRTNRYMMLGNLHFLLVSTEDKSYKRSMSDSKEHEVNLCEQ